MEWLETTVHLTIVAGFIGGILGGIFNFVVLRPLKDTLKNLQEAIEELREDNKNYRDQIRFLELSVTELKTQVQLNTKRIDLLEATFHGDLGHR